MEKLKIRFHKLSKMMKISFRSLLQHKLRASLSIFGIICGVMAFLTMISIGEGARRKIINQIEQLGIKNIYVRAVALTEEQKLRADEHLSKGLSVYDADRIRSGCRYIGDVGYLKEVKQALRDSGISPQIAAISSNYSELLNLSIAQGRFIRDSDIRYKSLICVAGDDVAKSLGAKGKIGSYIRIEDQLFKIVGILSRSDKEIKQSSVMSARNHNQMIFIPTGTQQPEIQSVQKKNEAELTEIVAQTINTDVVVKAGSIIARILELSHKNIDDYQIVIPQELLRQAEKTQRTFNITLGAIAGISLLVGGVGIMNIMLATVTERTKEIGVRRAIGATQQDIVIQFLTESVMLTVIGGIAGIGIGAAAVRIVSAFAGWDTAVTLFAIAVPLLMSVLLGIFFGLYPAFRAAKMDPVAALRHE